MLTAPQFAWACADAGDYPPPEPKRGERYGPDALCALCGGETHGVGWPRKLGLPDTFTDIPFMQVPASQTLCQPCVATARSEGWAQYVAAHPERGLRAAFDQKEGKAQRAWNWLYSSHLFIWPNQHECPDRARWREILQSPPEPPFLAIIAMSGKKQLIFKSRIAQHLTRFPVQLDDEQVLVDPLRFKVALADFDRLYLLGFSKDSILTADYHPASLMAAGIDRWRPAEERAVAWRRRDPNLWRLCHYVAQRPEGWEPPDRMVPAVIMPPSVPVRAAPLPPQPPQGTLF